MGSGGARGRDLLAGDEQLMTGPSYLVVACTPYSGSTLLASLLGAHPQIATVGEVSGTKRDSRMGGFRCSCHRLMVECPFWREVQVRMRASGFEDFSLGNFGLNFEGQGPLRRLHTGSIRSTFLEDLRDAVLSGFPQHEQSLRRLAERNQAFVDIVLEITGKKVFADASKEPMRLRYLHRFLQIDLKAVHLVRDVRGVAASAVKHGTQRDVAAAARMWARTNATIMRHIDRLDPDNRNIVRYEDLCQDPGGTMAKLYAFCGVDPLVGETLPTTGEPQHLLGNRTRLEALTEVRLDESWRSVLSPEQLETIRSESSSVARSLYPTDREAM